MQTSNQGMQANQAGRIMTEKDILQDCLSSQKAVTASLNTFAGECASEQLRSAFLNILDDEHRIQADIFTDMNANGWYPTQPADQQKLQQIKQKFSAQA
jgi:spore coat protein CotF